MNTCNFIAARLFQLNRDRLDGKLSSVLWPYTLGHLPDVYHLIKLFEFVGIADAIVTEPGLDR